MPLQAVLEALSVDTWERLRDSRPLQIRFGEETITDLLLLDLKRKNPPRTRIIQTPKSKEKDQGTDWEWWIGSPRVKWLRFAVQAKKLDLKTFRYSAFAHKVGSDLQIDLLERYATRNRAIPLYCLYNFAKAPATVNAWRCCQAFDEPQLACTVTPADIVRHAINHRGCRSFQWLHKQPQTLPWRCLARCPRVQRLFLQPPNSPEPPSLSQQMFGRAALRYSTLPSEVEGALTTGRLDSFSSEYYDPNLGLYPRRVVVLEFDPEEEKEFAAG